ncbi:MAG: hypothetical protein CW338_04900 [Clostridiales bacterium]|nr:hypothetical protein [Clostridiales bacterium]
MRGEAVFAPFYSGGGFLLRGRLLPRPSSGKYRKKRNRAKQFSFEGVPLFMTSKQKSLVGGVSILAVAGIICKLVGVLYRIPLANTVGGVGLGVYSKVFQSYNLLLTISSAGIPVAISRTVSFYTTRNDPRTAKRVFRIALLFLGVLGFITTVLMIAGSSVLSGWVKSPETKAGYIAIAPSLLLVCLMSAFRGYMQGHRKMVPTAISQLIEQVGKLAVALPLAVIGTNRGGPAYGAAGMLLGTSAAEAVALAYMVFTHYRSRSEFASIEQDPGAETPSGGKLGKDLLAIAVPITIGACIVPLAGWIDSLMVTQLMESNGIAGVSFAGMEDAAELLHQEAMTRYGLYSSVVLSLINVPTAIAMAVSTNLVPDITSGIARGDREYVAKESLTGLRIAAVVGFPCSVGMSVLARPILYMLYLGKYTPAQLDIAAQVLELSALTIILFTMVQATSGILQGCGKQRIPMYTLAAGVICKIGLNFLLIGDPDINIHGAPVASLVCYSVSMIPNLYFVKKYTGCRLDISAIVLRPLAAAAVMGGIVYALWRFVFTESALDSRLITAVAVVVCLIAGILVFGVCAFAFRAVRADDLPGRLAGKLKKIKFIS